jgi:putative transposase
MGNHVHLIAAPPTANALAKCFGRTHVDYARWLNVRRGETGHLWQNRFFSCPMDDRHHWEALRYIELNPVRAGLVQDAVAWPWSSAAAHAAGTDRSGILDLVEWSERWNPAAWREALSEGIEDAALLERIRQATRTGRPLASEEFVRELETARHESLRPRKRGPKGKPVDDGRQLTLAD